ncbi:MAG: ABC transporter permease [Clostridia bacterium]|jgi:D-methionine transport system permease protein|nr:ABC transporter permease [Clostridia bacterium]
MNKSIIYQLNIWIAEQLKTIAPNLYKYKVKFAESGEATLEMFWKAGLIAFVIGLILGTLLVVTKRGGIRRNPIVYHLANTIVNVFRSIPFIILLIFLIPYTRAIVGTSIKVKGAIMPLVFGTVPFYSRQVEVALSGVEEGKIEAARSMGSGTLGLIFRVYLPEAVPALIRVTTVTAISLIGLTTMAGAVGAGGLGSFAINYGQNQSYEDIVNVCVVVLLIVTIILQSLGNGLSRLTFNRKLITIRRGRKTGKAAPAASESITAES